MEACTDSMRELIDFLIQRTHTITSSQGILPVPVRDPLPPLGDVALQSTLDSMSLMFSSRFKLCIVLGDRLEYSPLCEKVVNSSVTFASTTSVTSNAAWTESSTCSSLVSATMRLLCSAYARAKSEDRVESALREVASSTSSLCLRSMSRVAHLSNIAMSSRLEQEVPYARAALGPDSADR